MCPLWGDHLSGSPCQENSLLAAPCRGTTHKAGATAPWHGTWCGRGGSDCWSRGQGGLCPAEVRLPCPGCPPRHTPAPLCWPCWRPGLRALRHTDAGCWEAAPWPPPCAHRPFLQSLPTAPPRRTAESMVSSFKCKNKPSLSPAGNGQRAEDRGKNKEHVCDLNCPRTPANTSVCSLCLSCHQGIRRTRPPGAPLKGWS